MRSLISLMIVCALAACSGGGNPAPTPPADVNPTGFWEEPDGSSWDIYPTVGGLYIVDFKDEDQINLHMTVSGNSFTMFGSETDLGGTERYDWNATGTINGDAMVGNLEVTATNLRTLEVLVLSSPFTAIRQ